LKPFTNADLCPQSKLQPGKGWPRKGDLAQSGATMAAITRVPSDNIIVFPAQVERLGKIVAGLEVPAVAETNWSEAAN
jgi:hypothetical protein